MPAYERLNPVKTSLNAPTAIALDSHECIFVTESVNNRLLMYTQSGQYNAALQGLQRPLSVAVDANGRILIGNKDSGNVEVYDADLTFMFKLGTGDGEFMQPNDIEIDRAGKVYVVDKEEDTVKIFNADGTLNFSFGSSGNGNGQFQNPTSIAIDDVTEELYVLDHELVQDMYGNQIEGARIQVFDMNGGFKRSFRNYGNEVGQMFRPQHITVDDESRLYVTDSFHNVVLVYDGNGVYLGDVFSMDNPMRTPLGITIGNSNRLFIASLSTGNVEVYGVDLFTQMEVSPLSLSFQGQQGGGSPAFQSVEIGNNGSAVLNWTAGTNDSWIILSSTGGTAQPTDVSTLDIGVNLNGLAAGAYTGRVTISATTGVTEEVEVELMVAPAPELSVDPLSLTFTSTNGSIPSSQNLSITNTGGGSLHWNALSDRSWITIDKAAGTAPDTIAVTVDPTSLGAGTYSGAITITGSVSSPSVIPVTLNIIELKGTINVTTNLPGATFTINGPASYSGSGTNWTQSEAPAGIYTIIFGDVNGYATPSSQSQTLRADGSISFDGTYVSQGTVQQGNNTRSIIAGAGPGDMNTGVVKIFQPDGIEAGVEFLAHGYNYGVNISAGDIDRDGIDEIITAPGPGANNPSEINIFDRNGNKLTGLSIAPFPYKYGANIAAGDFNGDGYHEVVAGAGTGEENPAEVKVFVYNPVTQVMEDSGIDLLAYNTGYGVRVAAGDIDGDGADEIITAPGPGYMNTGIVRIWEVDATSGVGQWAADNVKEITIDSRSKYSVSIASGDINGDGNYELVAGAGPDSRARDEIAVLDGNGDEVFAFRAYVAKRYGVNVASGDLDNDGAAEIVAGAGPGLRNLAIIKVFDSNGIEMRRFKALRTRFGVNVAVGNLGYKQ